MTPQSPQVPGEAVNRHLPERPADGKHIFGSGGQSYRCSRCGVYNRPDVASTKAVLDAPCEGAWAQSGKMRAWAEDQWAKDKAAAPVAPPVEPDEAALGEVVRPGPAYIPKDELIEGFKAGDFCICGSAHNTKGHDDNEVLEAGCIHYTDALKEWLAAHVSAAVTKARAEALREAGTEPVWPHTGEPVDRWACEDCGALVADCGGDEMLGWVTNDDGYFCPRCVADAADTRPPLRDRLEAVLAPMRADLDAQAVTKAQDTYADGRADGLAFAYDLIERTFGLRIYAPAALAAKESDR